MPNPPLTDDRTTKDLVSSWLQIQDHVRIAPRDSAGAAHFRAMRLDLERAMAATFTARVREMEDSGAISL